MHNLRSRSELYYRNSKIVKYATETISYLVLIIWPLVPNPIKGSKLIELHFYSYFKCLYICMYILCVCLPPGHRA